MNMQTCLSVLLCGAIGSSAGAAITDSLARAPRILGVQGTLDYDSITGSLSVTIPALAYQLDASTVGLFEPDSDIISSRHTSSASGGMVSRSRSRRKLHGFPRQVAHQLGLLPGVRVQSLHVLEGRVPVVAEPHLAGGPYHLRLAPGILPFADRNQFRGSVGDHLVRQVGAHAIGTDRVAHDRLVTTGLHPHQLAAHEVRVTIERRVGRGVGRRGPTR